MASTKNLSDLNRDYWNNHSDDIFQQEWVQALLAQIMKFLQANIDWIGIKPATPGAPIKMLDYACGNGLASRALFSHVTSVIGIDVSDHMVAKFNENARKQGLTEEQMHAVQGDLLATTDDAYGALKSAEFYNVDLIVMSMALHHVEDPQMMIVKLVERLRAGGVLVVIDWTAGSVDHKQPATRREQDTNENQDQGYKQPSAEHTMSRQGFTREEIDSMLKHAGCSHAEYVLHEEMSELPAKIGGKRQLFFARGQK